MVALGYVFLIVIGEALAFAIGYIVRGRIRFSIKKNVDAEMVDEEEQFRRK